MHFLVTGSDYILFNLFILCTEKNKKMVVFRDVGPCSLVEDWNETCQLFKRGDFFLDYSWQQLLVGRSERTWETQAQMGEQ
jgi:hypothetical protein